MVDALTVDHHLRDDVTLTYRLTVSRAESASESWVVTLPWVTSLSMTC
ncbi:hypothetical protein [Streptomyces bacillaris]